MAKADHIWEEVKERYARMKTYRHVESGFNIKSVVDGEVFDAHKELGREFLIKGSLSFKKPDYFNFSRWNTIPAFKGKQARDTGINAQAVGCAENFAVHRPKDDPMVSFFTTIFSKGGSSANEIDRNIFKCIPTISVPGSLAIIPSLLHDKIELPKDTIASPLKSLLLPDQVVDGRNCYHIILYSKKMIPRHLWIDKEMYVIRQSRMAEELIKSMDFTNFMMKLFTTLIPKLPKVEFDWSDVGTVLYDRIEINQEIPDNVFDPANVNVKK